MNNDKNQSNEPINYLVDAPIIGASGIEPMFNQGNNNGGAKKKKSNGKYIIISILPFAILFLFIASIIFLTTFRWDINATNLKVTTFSSYSELQTFLKQQKSEYQAGGCGFIGGCSGKMNAAPENSETNLQVEGVDEADIIKHDGRYIYTLSNCYSYGTIKNSEAESYYGEIPYAKISVIDTVTGLMLPIYFDENFNGNEMFLSGNQLIVLGLKYEWVPSQANGKKNDGNMGNEDVSPQAKSLSPKFAVRIYDTTNPANIIKQNELSVKDANLLSSRRIDNKLYLVLRSYDILQNEIVLKPTYWLDGEKTEVSITSVIMPPHTVSQYYQYTYIVTMDLPTAAVDDFAVMIGNSGSLYVNKGAFYISTNYYEVQKGVFGTYLNYSTTQTLINRFVITESGVDYNCFVLAEGNLLNQFSMDEYNGTFRVATTESFNGGGGGILTVFKINVASMEEIGKVEGLGKEKNERIYSVRFDNDICYLVTARQTDPLYVIDLSVPSSPNVLSELKIPDVSDYMHTYDENTIIGIGRQATQFGGFRGVQTSLFDVKSKTNPVKLSQFLFGENTESEMSQNHKALLTLKKDNYMVYGFGLWDYRLKTSQYHLFMTDGKTIQQITGIVSSFGKEEEFTKDGKQFFNSTDKERQRAVIIGNNMYSIVNGQMYLIPLNFEETNVTAGETIKL